VRLSAAVLAASLAVSGAEAASFVLDQGEMGRAVAVGQRSVVSETPFDGEWRVTNAAGEIAIAVTPFYRIALAARHAAFKNEPFTPAEREKLLREQKDRLPLWVFLSGGKEDFARHYAPRLLVPDPQGGEREIAPSFVQNERTALRQNGAFVARCVYGFPTKELTGTARLTLLVRDAEGREVSRFALDLARMR
jgi:hypothetical protein